MEQILVNLSNSQVQDILEELGMLEDGNCSYTAEEIFIAGMEYAINNGLSWLNENNYPSSKEELIENLLKAMKAEKVE
jgi:hypothetical protein